MVVAAVTMKENHWEDFALTDDDIEFIYSHLLEVETPLTPDELTAVLVEERIQKEIRNIEEQRRAGGEVYLPKETYDIEQKLVFPALGWAHGEVAEIRPGWNPNLGEFKVIKVKFADGEQREFASGLEAHKLNDSQENWEQDMPTSAGVLSKWGEHLATVLEAGLESNPDFVRIAGRWFPRALLLDINTGHLNLAEAILDMSGGGPATTMDLLQQIELSVEENPKLVEFSLDLALQEDVRFDEVGPAGKVMWFLKRLEPAGVQETPTSLRYKEIHYDPANLTPEMWRLVVKIDDELSDIERDAGSGQDVSVSLLYPHLRAGTLPLTPRFQRFFPTSYETPRIRFQFVDGETKQKFPGWVVRSGGYIFGLENWYRSKELMPGSIVRVRKSNVPGEVIVQADTQRSRRDWVRTVLVGTDGGMVFAMLKQVITAAYDERMAIMIPDLEALDLVWQNRSQKQPPFERTVVDTVRELTKLNPQGHVHASELYAAINLVHRCPPEPILALLASRPWFVHVGDLHFRFDDSAEK
jgi:hypothetical protein